MKTFIKPLTIVFIAYFLCSCSFQNNFKKVPDEKVDKALLQKAELTGIKILENFREKKYEPLSGAEATNEVQKGFTTEKQKEAHATIKKAFGEYVSMEYVEAYSDGELFLFRFRGVYSDNTRPEVRVVINKEGKLAGFFVLAWKNTL